MHPNTEHRSCYAILKNPQVIKKLKELNQRRSTPYDYWDILCSYSYMSSQLYHLEVVGVIVHCSSIHIDAFVYLFICLIHQFIQLHLIICSSTLFINSTSCSSVYLHCSSFPLDVFLYFFPTIFPQFINNGFLSLHIHR